MRRLLSNRRFGSPYRSEASETTNLRYVRSTNSKDKNFYPLNT